MLKVASRAGLTLTSIMVAVGLSGVLALAGMRLLVNQMNALRVMELKDKGDAIYKFYSNLLHDDKVWWCTLYDGREQNPPDLTDSNAVMRQCIFGKASKCFDTAGGTALRLMGPDCEFKEPLVSGRIKHRFKTVGAYDFQNNFESSSVTFIPEGGKTLKDSVVTADSTGWWDVELKWREMGSGAIDLIYTQKLDRDKWQNATTPKRYLPELLDSDGSGRVLRVRRSTNNVPTDGCARSGLVSIGLHTSSRDITCSAKILVTTSTFGGLVANCPAGVAKGAVVYSTAQEGTPSDAAGACTGNRVSVRPTDCSAQHSVIWKIGLGVKHGTNRKLDPANNVECALGGGGKMVKYSTCRDAEIYDSCAGFTNPPPPTPLPQSLNAIRRISASGELECATLMAFPTITDQTLTAKDGTTFTRITGQGPIGDPGPDGVGLPGPRGRSCP